MNRGILILGGLAAAVGGLYFYDKKTGGALGVAKTIDAAFDPTQALAEAIATAEGFYVAGSRPQRDNNPGDMTQDLIGRGVGMDGAFIVYASAQDGFDNLKAQITKWFDGSSANADGSSTIADISSFYTANDQDSWAANVAAKLGVSVDTPISDITGG